jgi:hypothetical protein
MKKMGGELQAESIVAFRQIPPSGFSFLSLFVYILIYCWGQRYLAKDIIQKQI